MQVIGLVGEKGGGKETFGNILIDLLPGKRISRVHFSDILSQTLELWSIPKTRENLQRLAVVMKDGFGPNTLPDSLYDKIISTEADIVILDGVRWHSDLKLVRSFASNSLIYISADVMTRFERLKKRNEKTFEDATTFEQFMREEKAENELLIPHIGSEADFKIINNGSIEDLRKRISECISTLQLN